MALTANRNRLFRFVLDGPFMVYYAAEPQPGEDKEALQLGVIAIKQAKVTVHGFPAC